MPLGLKLLLESRGTLCETGAEAVTGTVSGTQL